MWKLPRKRMCSSSRNFSGIPGEQYQETEGKGRCCSAEPRCSRFSWKKTGKLLPARTLLTEANFSRSLKSSPRRESQGHSPQQGALAQTQNLTSLSTRCCWHIYRNFLCFLNAGMHVHKGQPPPRITRELRTFNNNVHFRLQFNLSV